MHTMADIIRQLRRARYQCLAWFTGSDSKEAECALSPVSGWIHLRVQATKTSLTDSISDLHTFQLGPKNVGTLPAASPCPLQSTLARPRIQRMSTIFSSPAAR